MLRFRKSYGFRRMSLARKTAIAKAYKNSTRNVRGSGYGYTTEQLSTREEYDREIRRDDLREARIEEDRE